MTLYSYIVTSDKGFAPNPFHEVLTLACCKPVIRRVADEGDYIVGLSGIHSGSRVVYAMRVTEKITFGTYWNTPRFAAKRPDFPQGGIPALGDNIYRWDADKNEYRQAWSYHSNLDGSEHSENKRHDTKGNDYWVLISEDFIYWGGDGPQLPPNLARYAPQGLIVGRQGHRSCFDPGVPEAFVKWYEDQKRKGLRDIVGMPTEPLRDPLQARCSPRRC